MQNVKDLFKLKHLSFLSTMQSARNHLFSVVYAFDLLPSTIFADKNVVLVFKYWFYGDWLRAKASGGGSIELC